MCCRVRNATTAWQASCTATACRSRSMYSTSSGGPRSLSCLARHHVLPRDDLPAVPDRDDQRLVDQVLDRGAGGVRGDGGELVDLLGGELVGDLGEVALVGAHPAGLARVADPVDPVDAARPQQRLVQRLRHVRGHHDEDPVLGRRLRPHAEHPPADQRLMSPRGFFSPDSSVSSACSVPMPAATAHAVHAAHDEPAAGRRRARRHRRASPCASQQPAGVVGQVGQAVAARALERRPVPGLRPAARPDLRERAAAAERVGLVEEHDHAAVAERELAQLPEQRLDLEDADAHEHVGERAGVDEDVGLAGLAGDRLGHQRLAGAGRPPQQHAGRHVAALLLDRVRVLQEDDVLLDPRDHVVLAPDVGEPGVDVVRVVGVDAAAGEQPEQPDELERDEEEREQQLQDQRQGLEEQRGRLEERQDRRGVQDLGRHDREQRHEQDELEEPGEPVPGPVGEPAVDRAVEAAEHLLRPEAVVRGRLLTDEEVDLADQLEAREPEQPLRVLELDAAPRRRTAAAGCPPSTPTR